jgi:hypothetical protein
MQKVMEKVEERKKRTTKKMHCKSLILFLSLPDASRLIAIANEINVSSSPENKLDKLDETLLTKLAYTSQGSLIGLTAFLGGVVSQEVCLMKEM